MATEHGGNAAGIGDLPPSGQPVSASPGCENDGDGAGDGALCGRLCRSVPKPSGSGAGTGGHPAMGGVGGTPTSPDENTNSISGGRV